MTTLTELKTKAEAVGLDRGIVRLYGDLRKTETWEKALIANNTVTVEAEVIIDEPEVTEVEATEIIPFTPDNESHVLTRREMMLEEVERQREIFEHHNAHNAVDLPTPPPIVINVPAERRDIPPALPPSIPPDRTEIAEKPNTSPRPGEGRGDERFIDPDICSIAEKATAVRALLKAKYPGKYDDLGNLGDRLFEKIKEDLERWFEAILEDLDYCLDMNYLDKFYYQESKSLVELAQTNINKRFSIYDIWELVERLKKEVFQELLPFALHDIFKAGTPPVDCWACERESYWLVVEKPAPIPTLADDFGGVFIPNKFHELGLWIYVWKFPGMIQAENFFHHITDAEKYCMIPAKSPLKIKIQQLETIGA